ncbi:MAG: hypothetical protein ACLPX5_14135 [Dissulfurispiraceae bacterium]
MEFTDDEGKAFWPVYNEFQRAKQQLNDRTVEILNHYMNVYDTLSNEEADTILKEYLAIEK